MRQFQLRQVVSNFLRPVCSLRCTSSAVVTSSSAASLVNADGTAKTEMQLLGEWENALEEKFGTGTHRFRRALFREFCDEARAELYTKPPAPLGQWRVHHTKGTDLVHFTLDREHTSDKVQCLVIGRLRFQDPPAMASHQSFVDNHFVDIFIERNDVVIAYEVALVERYLEVKNIKTFKKDILEAIVPSDEGTLGVSAARIAERKALIYDGPSIHHLEEDFYNELHDLLINAEMDQKFQDFVGRWISYLEHIEYLRWSLSVQDSVLPLTDIAIDELITEGEEDIVKEPIDTWRRDESKN